MKRGGWVLVTALRAVACPYGTSWAAAAVPDPVAAARYEGNKRVEDAEQATESVARAFIVKMWWFNLGLNASTHLLLSGHGPGGQLAASGGPSLLLHTWEYEGSHRMTAVQLDANAGWGRSTGGLWLVALGPAYHGYNHLLVPVIKFQAYVSGPLSKHWHNPVSLGAAFTIGWDLTTAHQEGTAHGLFQFDNK